MTTLIAPSPNVVPPARGAKARHGLRDFVCTVSWIVIVVAGTFAVASTWFATQIGNEDNFVAFAAPLAQHADVQEYLADAVKTTVTTPGGGYDLDDAAGAAISSSMTAAHTKPGYQAAWDESARASHRLFSEAISFVSEVDVAPMVRFALDDIDPKHVVDFSAPDPFIVSIETVAPAAHHWLFDGTVARVAASAWLVVAVALLGVLFTVRRLSSVVLRIGAAIIGWGVIGTFGLAVLATTDVTGDTLLDMALADRLIATSWPWVVAIGLVGIAVLSSGIWARRFDRDLNGFWFRPVRARPMREAGRTPSGA